MIPECFAKMFEIAPITLNTVILGLSFLCAAISFYRSSPSEQRKRDQQDQMFVLAGRAVILWDQLKTLKACEQIGQDPDPYLFPSMRANAKRIEISLDMVIGLGLFAEVVGSDDYSLTLFTAFTQSLYNAFSVESDDPKEWRKDHLELGMTRLIDSCEKYHGPQADKQGLGKCLPRLTREQVEYSWTYLHRKTANS